MRGLETLRLSPAGGPDATPAASVSKKLKRIAAGHVRKTGEFRLNPKPADLRKSDAPGDGKYELGIYVDDLTKRAEEAHDLIDPNQAIRYIKDATDWTDELIGNAIGRSKTQVDYYLRRGGLRARWVNGDFKRRFYNVVGIVRALEIMHPGDDEAAKSARREEMRKRDDKRLDGRPLIQVLTGKKDMSAEVLGAIQQTLGEHNGRIASEGIEDDREGTIEEI